MFSFLCFVAGFAAGWLFVKRPAWIEMWGTRIKQIFTT